jgi:hypothetical protein
MTTSQKQRRFSWLVSCLIDWAYKNGYEIVLGEAYRTKEQQAIYVKTGKSKTMHSKHLRCLAIDINLFKDDKYLTDGNDYEPLGKYWESLDPECIWGGRFGDNPDTAKIEGWDGGHFQYSK